MRNQSLIFVISMLCSFLTIGSAFTIPACQTGTSSFLSTTSKTNSRFGLVLSSSPSPEEPDKKIAPTSGTYYDDEVEPAANVGISNAMKERLTREASRGLDPERSNTNVILYISILVVILIALAGQGILY